ncbi:MAG: zinc ribbon domain-containing protein [Nitrospira sp.]|nr:zinc ribbon domain-containing protein [Nitrospira sp.]MDD9859184.1 zinc ribbon domain-containing protein [Nitrospira sp.]
MPVYEYRCNACQYQFELLQSVTARQEDTSCPQCHQVNVHRLMSAFASQIKGEQKPGFSEMKARDMYNERMDKFKKLPPIMGARATPHAPRMTQHPHSTSEGS